MVIIPDKWYISRSSLQRVEKTLIYIKGFWMVFLLNYLKIMHSHIPGLIFKIKIMIQNHAITYPWINFINIYLFADSRW